MVEPLRHRQTKEAETDMFDLKAAAPHLDSTKLSHPAMPVARQLFLQLRKRLHAAGTAASCYQQD